MFVMFEGEELLVYDKNGRIVKLIKKVEYFRKYSESVFVAYTGSSLEVVSEKIFNGRMVVDSITDTDFERIYFKDEFIVIERKKPLSVIEVYNSDLICIFKLYKDSLNEWVYIQLKMFLPLGLIKPLGFSENYLYGKKKDKLVKVDLKTNKVTKCAKKELKGISLKFLKKGGSKK